MLLPYLNPDVVEAGLDEAGRGCLAGAVFAAAVILPKDYRNERLNDSKKLSEKARYRLRTEIEHDALAWAVGVVSPREALLVDGNRFRAYRDLPCTTVVKGDGKYMSIAAASILAKTYRDDYMLRLHEEYPMYHWDSNKGYPAKAHREAIRQYGTTPYHRMTYNLLGDGQLQLFPPGGGEKL